MDAVTAAGEPALARGGARVRPWWWPLLACCVGYLLVLAAWSAPAPDAQEAPPAEHDIKAAFLYKFLSYVEWRPGAFAQPTSPIVIGVVGSNDIADTLRALVAGRTVSERPVEVRRMRAAESLDGVHMLFVGSAEASRVPQLAAAARQRGVLVVTEHDGALDDGSAINLIVVDNRVRFEVSLDAVERSGLKVSSRMLTVAVRVRQPR
jgi:hypothetical protein